MKIAVSCDHRGMDLLDPLRRWLQGWSHVVVPVPAAEGPACDYPDFAYLVGCAVAEGRADRGILLSGWGIGMAIAANKVPGVRAALVADEVMAEASRRHTDANVLCLPRVTLGAQMTQTIVAVWLRTEFEGGRHARRVAKTEAIEAGRAPWTAIAVDGPAARPPADGGLPDRVNDRPRPGSRHQPPSASGSG